MTIDLNMLIRVLLLGMAVGSFYFSSLWWTVRRLPHVRHRLRWFLINWGLRVLACLGGAAAIGQQTLDFGQRGLSLTLYLVGFLLVRTIWLITLQVDTTLER